MDGDDKVIDIKGKPRKRMPTADKPFVQDAPLIMETWPIERFNEYPKNPRKNDPVVVDRMVRNIREFGFRIPICAKSTDNEVVDGHLRLRAARKLGMTHLPVALADNLSDVQIKAFRLAANRSANWAEWDNDLLKIELAGIKAMGFDLEMTGFDDNEIMRLGGEWDKIEDVPSELPGAKALKSDMVFPQDGPYGIPALLPDKLGRLPADTKVWFRGPDLETASHERVLWMFKNSSLVGIPRDRISIGFYVNDFQFECVWEDPATYAAKFINMGVRELISPNFTIDYKHAEAVMIWNVYRSRWIARYMQEAGLTVIPDIQYTTDKWLEFTMTGIPKGAPAISMQLQNRTLQNERLTIRANIAETIRQLEPQSLIIYGGAYAESMLKDVDLPEVIILPSMGEMRTNWRKTHRSTRDMDRVTEGG